MITKEQIKNLAKLARLKLSDEEIESLAEDLSKILNYVKKIEELNLENIEPLTSIIDKLEFREDEERKGDDEEREKIINNFPQRENNYLKVPKILEK